MSDSRIVVGSFVGAFGVRGDVRVKSYCADPADIARYTPLTTDKGHVFRVLVIKGEAPGALVARIEGIDTKEDADALRGLSLYAERARLPRLPDDEFYHADLIGLAAHDTGGKLLGTVRAVLNHGAGDLLEILVPGAPETVLIPFTLAAVPTVGLAAGRIVVDPPEGLF
jgi:16S rRNA processing protein RimM